MKNLNQFISEKLKINKNSDFDNNPLDNVLYNIDDVKEMFEKFFGNEIIIPFKSIENKAIKISNFTTTKITLSKGYTFTLYKYQSKFRFIIGDYNDRLIIHYIDSLHITTIGYYDNSKYEYGKYTFIEYINNVEDEVSKSILKSLFNKKGS